MDGLWLRIPEFWKGVLASITGALILMGVGFALRIVSSSAREWMRNRRFAIQAIREQLVAQNGETRIEANLQILFNVLKWLILGGLFWVIPDAIYFLFRIEVFFLAKILSAVSIVIALRWAFVYQRPRVPAQNELGDIVTSSVFRLFFNPPNRSKPITFEADGCVGEGRNKNEHSWRIQNNKLELIQEDGEVHSRFAYDPRTATFFHTNETDTLSLLNQYIVTVQSRRSANHPLDRSDSKLE